MNDLPIPKLRQTITIKELATRMRVTTRVIDSEVREGRLKEAGAEGSSCFLPSDIREWLDRRKGQVSDEEVARNALIQEVHNLVTLARREGRLTPGPCEVCGSPFTDGHHEDYAKPLEVRWLCTRHHAQFHAQLRWGKTQSLDQYVAEAKAGPEGNPPSEGTL